MRFTNFDDVYNDFNRQNLKLAYGLPPEWDIDGVAFHENVCAVLASMNDYLPGQCCQVPGSRRGHDKRFFRGAPLAGRHVQILLTYPVYQCPICRKTIPPPLPPSGVLPVLENMVADFVLSGDIASASRLFALERRKIAEIAEKSYRPHIESREVPAPRYLGIDGTRALGKDYVMLVDLDRSKHVEMLEYKSFGPLVEYLIQQKEHWSGTLECVVIDPHKPLKNAINRAMPGMKIVLDRYHVSQLLNSKINKWAVDYKEQHGLKIDVRSLRHSDRPAYEKVVRRLKEEGHGALVDAYEYVERIKQVYETPNSKEAREVWLNWVSELSPLLQPVLGATIHDLNTYWRAELCNAADYHVPSRIKKDEEVVLSNGMTESLHKRLQGIIGSATRLGFESMRSRLLLTDTGPEQEEMYREDRLALKEAKRYLQEEAQARGTRTRTTIALS